MTEESHFFRPVREFCRRAVVTCQAHTPLPEVVEQMCALNISSVVVLDQGLPVGILTDRDLRNKVVASGNTAAAFTAADIMHGPLETISENGVLYEALHRMLQLRIHRLGVVSSQGELTGIITQTDLLKQQAHSPQELVLDIAEAQSIEALRALHDRIQALVLHLAGTGIRTRDLVRMIAHINDQILQRLIDLLQQLRHPELPRGFCFVVMGSEGRSEQTLWTDQDNAIVYADDLSEPEIARLKAFAEDLIEQLIAIGVPSCPGGIMAKNAAWFRSLSAWKKQITQWATHPVPEHIMNASMFVDLRAVYGDASLTQALRQHVFAQLAQDRGFLIEMAQGALAFKPPLGWFGKIKTAGKGPEHGVIDIKKAGLFAITEGIKALSLELADLQGGTLDRIAALASHGVLSTELREELEDSFEFLLRLRLQGQIQALRAGREPSNKIALKELHRMERVRLRAALEGAAQCQSFLQQHFALERLA